MKLVYVRKGVDFGRGSSGEKLSNSCDIAELAFLIKFLIQISATEQLNTIQHYFAKLNSVLFR